MGTAAPRLTVTFKTTQIGAEWAPKSVVAVWIEGPSLGVGQPGPFVKTIGRWAGIRAEHLVAWRNRAGLNDVDAVTGATRLDHDLGLLAEWDLKNKLGELVLDGLYTIRLETADGNSTASGQNWQGTFTFTKGLAPEVQTVIDPDDHYREVTIDFNPTAGECNNGIVDPGETCDPPGSCLTTCAEGPNACSPTVLIGSSLTCDVACAIQPITSCINGDGCCADGCSDADDTDCIIETNVDGGCAASNTPGAGAAFVFGLVGLFGLVLTRSRRRR